MDGMDTEIVLTAGMVINFLLSIVVIVGGFIIKDLVATIRQNTENLLSLERDFSAYKLLIEERHYAPMAKVGEIAAKHDREIQAISRELAANKN